MSALPLTAVVTLGIAGNPVRPAWGGVSVALSCRQAPWRLVGGRQGLQPSTWPPV